MCHMAAALPAKVLRHHTAPRFEIADSVGLLLWLYSKTATLYGLNDAVCLLQTAMILSCSSAAATHSWKDLEARPSALPCTEQARPVLLLQLGSLCSLLAAVAAAVDQQHLLHHWLLLCCFCCLHVLLLSAPCTLL